MALYGGFDLSGVKPLTDATEEKTSDGGALDLGSVRPLSNGSESPLQLSPEETAKIEGPMFRPVETSTVEDIKDFVTGTARYLKHGETYSMVMNSWKSLFNSAKNVPVYDDKGELVGVREETPDEVKVRLASQREQAKNLYDLPDDDSAQAYLAKGLSVVMDPTTYIPFGKTYKEAAAIGAGISMMDGAAYEAATNGEVGLQDMGLYAAFGAILGPAGKLIIDKAIPLYRMLRGKGAPHVQAMEETLKALPKPKDATEPLRLTGPKDYLAEGGEQKLLPYFGNPEAVKLLPAPVKPKLLPAPKDSGHIPYYVDRDGRMVKTPLYGGSGLQEVTTAEQRAIRQSAQVADSMAATEEKAMNDITNHFKQGGSVDPRIQYHLASSGVGAAVGAYADDENPLRGAAAGALAGLAAPTAWRHIVSKPIGMLNKWSKSDAAGHFATGKFASAPTAVLKRFGAAGRKLADDIDNFHMEIDTAVGEKLFQTSKAMRSLNKEEVNIVRGLLDHTVKPSAASPKTIAAAKNMRRLLNATLDDAVESGMMSAKKAQKLKMKAAKDGYFPRVYNYDKLSSQAGKEEWIKAWTEFTGNKKDLVAALESLIGDKDLVAKMVAKSDGTLTRGQALDILRILRNRGNAQRSAHLEHSRTINESAEKILRPFLVEDTGAVLAKYYEDAYRSVAGHKTWGGLQKVGKSGTKLKWHPDTKAEKIFESLAADHGGEAEKFARDVYYTSVGDARSSITDRYLKLGEAEGRVLRGLGGFETGSKLALAQVANMLQGTVNGMSRLLKVSGNPYTSLRLYTKGLLRAASKEGGEYAARSGAALETTLMEIAGEASNMGKFGEKVLKYSGFISAEKMQRRLGANLGKVYAEELAEKFTRIQDGSLKGWRAKRVLAQMKELGLPTDRAIIQTDIDRAGLRFSNEINFRNTPDKLPMAWQTPYGKLFTKFKSFSFHQARFVKNNVIKPFLRGNPWPLLWYTAPAASLGMSVDELRRMVKGDDRELSMTERYLRGLTMVGGMGILQDTISSFSQSQGRGLASLAGPAISDVTKVGAAGLQAIEKQDPVKVMKALAGIFVIPGGKTLISELSAEGSSRGGSRGNSRGGSRGGGR